MNYYTLTKVNSTKLRIVFRGVALLLFISYFLKIAFISDFFILYTYVFKQKRLSPQICTFNI